MNAASQFTVAELQLDIWAYHNDGPLRLADRTTASSLCNPGFRTPSQRRCLSTTLADLIAARYSTAGERTDCSLLDLLFDCAIRHYVHTSSDQQDDRDMCIAVVSSGPNLTARSGFLNGRPCPSR